MNISLTVISFRNSKFFFLKIINKKKIFKIKTFKSDTAGPIIIDNGKKIRKI
tara:strand:+ start:88 stop:243 length:156 start_codon:yes stop_codon:yes gene_type:complete